MDKKRLRKPPGGIAGNATTRADSSTPPNFYGSIGDTDYDSDSAIDPITPPRQVMQ